VGKIAIHGFGRIGRASLRAALRLGVAVPAVISDIKEPQMLAALLSVDTNYGLLPVPVTADAVSITAGSQ
jgi:glyceraldehyde 3-phosphate dehydrogenase